MQTKQRKVVNAWEKLFSKLALTGYSDDGSYLTLEPMTKSEILEIWNIANSLGIRDNLFHPDHGLDYFSKLKENDNVPLFREASFLKVYHYVYLKNLKNFKYNLIGHSRKSKDI